MKVSCFLMVFMLQLACMAGNSADYVPKTYSKSLESAYLDALFSHLKQDLDGLDGAYKTELKNIYKARAHSIESRVKNEHFFFNPEWTDYIHEIADHIFDSNPLFDYQRVEVIISRYHWPNAFSFGEGTLVINLGLIRHLKSEDELAFALCHELAHYLLNHSEKSIIQTLQSRRSQEFQDRIDQIKKSDYYQVTQLKELLKDNLYSERRHSRDLEYSADSLGLKLFLNTDYNPMAAISLLNTLDLLNNYVDPISLDLYTILGIVKEEQPKSGGFIVQTIEPEVELDSVVTHPDCKNRITALEQMIPGYPVRMTENEAMRLRFAEFHKQVAFEMVESFMKFQNYDLALLYAMRLELKYPESTYCKLAIAHCLYILSWSRKEHTSSVYASRFSDYRDSTAAVLQELIFETRLRALMKAAYNYNLELYKQDIKNEELIYAMYWFSVEFNFEKQAGEMKREYIHSYPTGKYMDYLLDH